MIFNFYLQPHPLVQPSAPIDIEQSSSRTSTKREFSAQLLTNAFDCPEAQTNFVESFKVYSLRGVLWTLEFVVTIIFSWSQARNRGKKIYSEISIFDKVSVEIFAHVYNILNRNF